MAIHGNDDELRLVLSEDDVVVLSRSELDRSRNAGRDFVAFLSGYAETFPPFGQPVYDGDQGLVQVSPGNHENRGYYGGSAETRLVVFAHLVRPFSWVDDPRTEHLQDLVSAAGVTDGGDLFQGTKTADLWDALYVFARGERFVGGVIASNSVGLTRVANEIRRRLLASRTRQIP